MSGSCCIIWWLSCLACSGPQDAFENGNIFIAADALAALHVAAKAELEASLGKVSNLPIDMMPSYEIKWN